MTFADLLQALTLAPADSAVRFLLPDGGLIPAHAHVTEVGRVDKRFIDCGGTVRSDAHCLLQTWVADDVEHRIKASTLAGILAKGRELVADESLPVQVEYEEDLITQFPLTDHSTEDGVLYLHLGLRHTDCLAKDVCIPGSGCCA
jgi:Family of unknown function (DUF6428)